MKIGFDNSLSDEIITDITLCCSLENGGFLPQAHRWAGGDRAFVLDVAGGIA